MFVVIKWFIITVDVVRKLSDERTRIVGLNGVSNIIRQEKALLPESHAVVKGRK